jgi:hypothetical protein|tara:strand:+ start:1524 stop:2300 length:777 start_codon:yes stop_codon:yes gene_type:complete
MYFNNFPTLEYNMDSTENTTTVTDVFRRIGIRKGLGDFITNYYKRILNTSERPEVASFGEYGTPDKHWIMMMVNNIEDPYYDWILNDEQMDKFVATKYSGKTIVFPTSHLSDGSYGDVDSDPIERFFMVGERVTEHLVNGDETGDHTIGTVTEFDPTNLNLTYSVVSGTFGVGSEVDNFVKGVDSGAVGKISSISNHTDAPHHYEDSDSNITDRSGTASIVTNRGYEMGENEKKRTVNVLMPEFASRFDEELKNTINN